VNLDRIAQIAIPVRDLPRATAFYRDTLGMRFLFDAAPGLAFFDCGGVRLMLAKPEQSEADREASIIYYRVDNMDTAVNTLRTRGVTLVADPHVIARLDNHDIWMAFFRDSEHNLLALTADVPR
jgi:catechol 2,3-dioxygenase-like lactoylglutathione lyase family enzyme